MTTRNRPPDPRAEMLTAVGTKLVHCGDRWDPARPLAAFDLDGTLVPYRRGKYELSELDLALALARVRPYSRNFNVAVFTNRAGDGAKHARPLRQLLEALDGEGVSVDLYAATARDSARKPCLGMWECFSRFREFSPPGSFFCGDAAGREGDFAATDHWFAHNAGLPFVTPEEAFGDEPWPAEMRPLRLELLGRKRRCAVAGLLAHLSRRERVLGRAARGLRDRPEVEVVVLVGAPGSGKTSFARRLGSELGWAHVSRDDCGTLHKALAAAREALGRGGRVVFDSTAPTHYDRACILRGIFAEKQVSAANLARSLTVVVDTPLGVCCHNDRERASRGERPMLPRAAMHRYAKVFEEPPGALAVRTAPEIRLSPADRVVARMPGLRDYPAAKIYLD